MLNCFVQHLYEAFHYSACDLQGTSQIAIPDLVGACSLEVSFYLLLHIDYAFQPCRLTLGGFLLQNLGFTAVLSRYIVFSFLNSSTVGLSAASSPIPALCLLQS